MTGRVIVLNGASSSGKTLLGRALQNALPEAWLLFGIDDFVNALPPRLKSPEGIDFAPDGSVQVGETFRKLERAWMTGLAATAQAGANLIIDDVLLSGAAGQERWKAALHDLPTTWIGVTCSPEAGEARESQRPDRVKGMHRQQAALVHQGVEYDLTVDTTQRSPEELAAEIRGFLPHGSKPNF